VKTDADMVADTCAVVLCGGESRRLGFPKEMLRVDGAPLAAKLVERLRAAFASVSVISNRPEYLSCFVDAPIYRDDFPGFGPLAGLHAGLKHAPAERSLFLACDMPLAHIDMILALARRATRSPAPAVLARADGRVQPLFGVYSRTLVPGLEQVLARNEDLSVTSFLKGLAVDYVDFAERDAHCLRDIDSPADLALLAEAFSDVEPLPVMTALMTRRGAEGDGRDTVVEEWPVAVYANGTRLATVLSTPTALKELALGFISYLGLVRSIGEVRSADVDYRARRITLELEVENRRIRNAIQQLVTSTCGANVYGSPLPQLEAPADARSFSVRRSHILECIQGLRAMAPVFEKTGCTHQAAWSDGERMRFFFEDIGRHNAVDKIAGAAMLAGRDLSHGALVTTGRLNSEMVIKALRAGTPVLASRSAVTSNAILLAENHGLTLVGFARGGRMNVYTSPERIIDE
jgi:FdhD protein